MILLQTEGVQPSLDVLGLLLKGGVVMIPLALLSVIALILIAERLMFFSNNMKANDKDLAALTDLLSQGKKNEALQLCKSSKGSWGRIFIYSGMTSEDLDKVLEDAANVEVARLEKGLGYLSMIAGLAPLLGFVGTIVGVITIFFDISISQDISISIISEGLYKKMITSAAGLVVGIIAFSAYHLFQHQIDGFVAKIQEHSLALKVALNKGSKN